MVNDPLIKDDQAIILSIKDKGLVVMTGCGMQGTCGYDRFVVWIESMQWQPQLYFSFKSFLYC